MWHAGGTASLFKVSNACTSHAPAKSHDDMIVVAMIKTRAVVATASA